MVLTGTPRHLLVRIVASEPQFPCDFFQHIFLEWQFPPPNNCCWCRFTGISYYKCSNPGGNIWPNVSWFGKLRCICCFSTHPHHSDLNNINYEGNMNKYINCYILFSYPSNKKARKKTSVILHFSSSILSPSDLVSSMATFSLDPTERDTKQWVDTTWCGLEVSASVGWFLVVENTDGEGGKWWCFLFTELFTQNRYVIFRLFLKRYRDVVLFCLCFMLYVGSRWEFRCSKLVFLFLDVHFNSSRRFSSLTNECPSLKGDWPCWYKVGP